MFGQGKKAQEGEKSGLYAIYDRVAEEAGPAFVSINDGVAVRAFRQLLQGSDIVAQDEYQLYKLGTYDIKTMEVKSHDPLKIEIPPVLDDKRQLRLPNSEVAGVK